MNGPIDMIDRVNGPQIISDFPIRIPDFKVSELENGIQIFELYSSVQPIIKMDLILKSGRIDETTKASGRACLSMMKEGTHQYSSNEFAELFDYYGAEYYTSFNLDDCKISLVTIDKHFDQLFGAWSDILFNPSFDETDFKRYQSISAQRLEHQLSKNEIIAYRTLTEKLFGSDHPYGYNTEVVNISELEINDLKHYYSTSVINSPAAIFISGNFSNQQLNRIKELFSKKQTIQKHYHFPQGEKILNNPKLIYPIGQSHQTSIKLGALLFERKHPDFTGMYVLNTILGGFFGSRLMTNLREEKGWCYNIYSGIDCMRFGGYWYIAADVGNTFVDKAIKEIYLELDKLKTDLIQEEELKMVKNYLMGYMLSLLDGPFASSKVLQGAWKNDIEIKYILDFCDEIRNISVDRLRNLANQYFVKDQMIELRVGKHCAD